MVKVDQSAFLGELARLFRRGAHLKGPNTVSITFSRCVFLSSVLFFGAVHLFFLLVFRVVIDFRGPSTHIG